MTISPLVGLADATLPISQPAFSLPLSISILAFGAVALWLQMWVMVKRGKGWGPVSSRLVGLTLFIVAALFISTSGVAHDNTTAVLGFLGTITGFVIGNKNSSTE
jgi:hypothetical protein